MLWISAENRTKLKKLLNFSDRLRWIKTPQIYRLHLFFFLSAIAVMQVIFWTEDDFCFISYCRDSFNGKFKKLINKQKILYCPTNALCSSEEPLKKRHLKNHTFIDSYLIASLVVHWISVNENKSSFSRSG